MSDISTVRRKIGDRTKSERDILQSNGVDRVVNLQHGNVWNVVVIIAQNEADPETYTVEAQAGQITFLEAPAEGLAVAITYLYAAYSDAELQELIDGEGCVLGATIAAIEELTMDTARFYDFTQGETSEKRSQVFSNLMKLLESYKKERDDGGSGTNRGSGMKVGKRTVGRQDRGRFPHHLTGINESPSRGMHLL